MKVSINRLMKYFSLLNVLIVLFSLVFTVLIILVFLFIFRFGNGLSNNQQDWYNGGQFLISISNLLLIGIIAIFVHKYTIKSANIPEQNSKYSEIIKYIDTIPVLLRNNSELFIQYTIEISRIIEKLADFSDFTYVFDKPNTINKELLKIGKILQNYHKELYRELLNRMKQTEGNSIDFERISIEEAAPIKFKNNGFDINSLIESLKDLLRESMYK